MVSHPCSTRLATLAALLAIASCQELILTDEVAMEKTIAGVPVRSYDLAYQGNTRSHAVVKIMDDEGSSVVDQKESWIAVFKEGARKDQVESVCDTAGEQCTRKGGNSFAFVSVSDVTEDTLAAMVGSAPGAIGYFEPDLKQSIPEMELADLLPGNRVEAARAADIWNMNIIGADARPGRGGGAHIFILDTGVNTQHEEFQGRAIPWADLACFFCSPDCSPGDTSCARDVNGHGTHVGGSAAGRTVGVAPAARVYGVKVLGDLGFGFQSAILDGMSRVADATDLRPAVITMSLGGPRQSASYEDAINALDDAGVIVVVAAGNEFQDACTKSPAYVPKAITVGATDSKDVRATYSNWGSCVDIFAPGSEIFSADTNDLTGVVSLSGTSMACPHVAGAAAILVGQNPALSPAEVVAQLRANAATNYVERLSPQSNGNERLYVGNDAPPLEKSPRTQIDWPADAFFSSCSDRGLYNRGPLEDYGMANCQCAGGTVCYNATVKGCPISPELEALQGFNPTVVFKELFWQWDCAECNCVDEDWAPSSGLASWAVALLLLLGFCSAGPK